MINKNLNILRQNYFNFNIVLFYMVKFIFDLDYTLYSANDCIETDNSNIFYNSFRKKNFMNHLLDQIKHDKYIFTNGSYSHAELVLEKLDNKELFKDVVSTDMVLDNLKPAPIMYEAAIRKFNIKNGEKVYFFEDSEENLQMAKDNYNWNTVLIDPISFGKKPKYVDYRFKTIEEALLFFIVKEKFNKKKYN